MSDKPKRKNNDPVPRRYWWIFGTLAIVLLIGLRFPVRILSVWSLNPVLYGVITSGCLIATICVARSHGWKRQLIAIMVLCALLSGWQTVVSMRQGGLNSEFCSVAHNGLVTRHRCTFIGNCPTLLRDYATIGNLPIGIELLDYYDNPCGYPRNYIESM
jgi:hypothetical protein